MDNGYPAIESKYHTNPPTKNKNTKKPLIIGGTIILLMVCFVGVAAVFMFKTENTETDDSGAVAASGEQTEEDVSSLVDLADQTETLPDGFMSAIVNDPNISYKSTSTDIENSNTTVFEQVKESISNGDIKELLYSGKIEVAKYEAMNSNMLNYYLDNGKIVVIESTGSEWFEGGGIILVYGGDLLDGTYYLLDNKNANSEPIIISKLDLFKSIETSTTFYVVSGESDE
jgi:hypothetical protein